MAPGSGWRSTHSGSRRDRSSYFYTRCNNPTISIFLDDKRIMASSGTQAESTGLEVAVPRVELAKHLGMNLDSGLNWKHHVLQISEKVRQIYWVVERNAKTFLESKILIYKSIFKPVGPVVFNYGIVPDHQIDWSFEEARINFWNVSPTLGGMFQIKLFTKVWKLKGSRKSPNDMTTTTKEDCSIMQILWFWIFYSSVTKSDV